MRTIWRLPIVLFLGLLALTLFASPAWAQTSTSSSSPPIPIGTAQLIALAVGFVCPFLTSLVTRYAAPAWVKGLVAFVITGATAVATWATDTPGALSWRGALWTFAVAAISAAGFRVTITGGLDTKLALKTDNFGITSIAHGKKIKEAKAAQAAAEAGTTPPPSPDTYAAPPAA